MLYPAIEFVDSKEFGPSVCVAFNICLERMYPLKKLDESGLFNLLYQARLVTDKIEAAKNEGLPIPPMRLVMPSEEEGGEDIVMELEEFGPPASHEDCFAQAVEAVGNIEAEILARIKKRASV